MDGRKRASPRLGSELSASKRRPRVSPSKGQRATAASSPRRRTTSSKPKLTLEWSDFKRAARVVLVATAVAVPVVLWQLQLPQRLYATTVELAHGAFAGFGLRLDEVVIDGAHNSTRDEILGALGVSRGVSLFSLDLEEIQRRLADVPWVRDAQVQRRWPRTLYLRITEHHPIAYWQKEGELFLVDETGGLIHTGKDISVHNLPVLTGEDAPQKAPELLKVLNEFKEIQKRVSGAVYMSKRRWDIILDGKLRVKLPENKMKEALSYLVELEQKHQLSNKDIIAVDLRLPDRVFFSLTPDAAKENKETKSKAA
ncbi:MAG: cell division protein FtsQ/DivIB [Holosporales bacterium]